MMKGKQDVLSLHGFNKQETLISFENLSQGTIFIFYKELIFFGRANVCRKTAETGCQREHFITAIG